MRESRGTPCLWDYEERRSWEVIAVEYQVDTVVAVDGFPTIEKNMTEKMVSPQAALNVAVVGMDMSNNVQHF